MGIVVTEPDDERRRCLSPNLREPKSILLGFEALRMDGMEGMAGSDKGRGGFG